MPDRNNSQVQLGCGTLIIIAIIVMIFSGGRGSSGVRKDVKALEKKIERLEKKIDDLSKKLDENREPRAVAAPVEQ